MTGNEGETDFQALSDVLTLPDPGIAAFGRIAKLNPPDLHVTTPPGFELIHGNGARVKKPRVDKLILISIFITICVSLYFVVSVNDRKMFNLLKGEKSSDFSELASNILNSDFDGSNEDAKIDSIIKAASIAEIINLSDSLYKTKDIDKQKFSAVLLAEAGNKYRSYRLLLRSARYYMASPIRDYISALKILDNDYIFDQPIADYYRGLIWQDTANPSRDVAKARRYFEKASKAGVPAAEKMLLRLSPGPVAPDKQQK